MAKAASKYTKLEIDDMVRRYVQLHQSLNLVALAHDTSAATVRKLLAARNVVRRRSGQGLPTISFKSAGIPRLRVI